MKHYFLIILTLGLFWNAGMLSAQNHVVNDELTNVTYRALLIGNANYQHWPKLKTSVRDVEALANILIRHFGFSGKNTRVLKNVTREKMLAGLDWLRKTSLPQDRVLIYYAGHGEYDEREDGYWVPIDGNQHNTFRHLSNTDVLNRLRAIDATHKLLIADSCFSGTLLTRGKVKLSEGEWNGSGYFRKKSQLKAVLGLTSGGNEPVSDGGPQWNGHSIFAFRLLEQLETNRRAFFSATELGLKVTRLVADDTARFSGTSQTPRFQVIMNQGHQGGEFFFIRPDFQPQKVLIAYQSKSDSISQSILDGASLTLFDGFRKLLENDPQISVISENKIILKSTWDKELIEMMKASDVQKALVFSLHGQTRQQVTMLWQGMSILELTLRSYERYDNQLRLMDTPISANERLPLKKVDENPEFQKKQFQQTAEKLLKTWDEKQFLENLPNFFEPR